ncbi:MAG: hypothetical protein L6Q97_00065 [Thermoanaerobaculia bacterium]|nr:hypothetical protein [Thermoanaerobaculia bacterium]
MTVQLPYLIFLQTYTRLLLASCWLLLLAPATAGADPALWSPPNWTLNPADYQFNMNMVIRIRYNAVPSNDANNVLGVFVGPELRGVATPTNFGGQMYYFVTVYANQYTGEMLRFRAYYAADDKVYATQVSVPFLHHGSTGSIFLPFWVDINPNIDFAQEILPIPPDTTLQTLPFDPVNLDDYLLSLDGDPVTWSVVAGPNLSASINNGVLTVTPVSPAWTGTESVQIKATEQTPNQYIAMRTAQFTVLPDYGPPVLQPIPPQTIFPGDNFTSFDLDDYLQFNGGCRAFEFRVFPYAGNTPDPAWPAVPPGPQPMSIVARPLFADVPLAGPGAKLAAFVNNTLVGTASPSGTPPFVYYSLSLQNLAAGPVTFRFYHAPNQYLYEKTTTLQFSPGAAAGTPAGPYPIQFAPLVPALAADGAVQVTIADPDWLGDFPVDFIVKDCRFPAARRDTAQALFSIVADNRPAITSPPAVNFTENACSLLYDAQATDPNESEGNGLTFSLAGGADETRFAVNPVNGRLSWFNFSPDFENPADANADNIYEVNIRVTNSLNLTDEIMLAITVKDQVTEPFQAFINGGAPALCRTGNAQLQASGGSIFLWSTGSTNASITVGADGVYTVTVTNDLACTASASIIVSGQPAIAASGSGAPVCAGSDIALKSTPSGGSGMYAGFAWTGPNGFGATVEDPAPFPAIPAASGVYTVTVTDAGGCTATASTTITVSGNSAPAITAMNNGPLCAGASLSLAATASGGSGMYTVYKWAGPNGYVANLAIPPAFTASAAATGTYTITVTDNAGCTASATTAVQVKPLPGVVADSNSPLCTGAIITLGATPSGGSGPGYTFTWAGPNGFSANTEDPAPLVATLAAAGAYTVTVTDAGGCTATGTVAVSVNGLPVVTAGLLAPVCAGGNITLGATPSGGSGQYSAFQWAGPDTFTAQVQNPSAFPAAPAAAGVYTVTVTDAAGCTATGSVVVVINPLPVISATSNSPVCEGNDVILSSTVSGGSGIYSLIQWSGSDSYVASTGAPAPFTATSASAGVYQVEVTDNKGCTATAATPVVVNAKPNLTAGSNSPVCLGANIDLKATASGGSGVYSTYNWTGPDAYTANQMAPTGFPATLSRSGIYHVTVTDNTGCTATAFASVAVSGNAAPAVVASGNGPRCAGANILLTSLPSAGSGVYSQFKWSGPDNYASLQQNPPAFPASAAAAGYYTVTVTDNKGCSGTSSVSVQVSAPKATPTTNTPICLGSDIHLSAGPSGSIGVYTAFSWAGPNGFTASGEYPAAFAATAQSAGTYTVTVTDNLGCSGTGTVAVSLSANNPPSITCPPEQTLAAGPACTAQLGSWTALAANVTDDCTAPGNILLTQIPAAGTLLSGHNDEETVTLTADDGTGNTTSCSFKVVLKDITLPAIICPSDKTVAADANCSALVGNWASAATGLSDNCTAAASIQVTQMPAPNTALTGHNDEETVTLTANDGYGNATSCTFRVILKDVTPPSIACPPNQTVPADAACSGTIGDRTGLAGVLDNCAAAPSIAITQMPDAGTVLSGHNDEETLTLTANDGHGNTASCTFKVILKDLTPPSITCPNPVAVDCAGDLPAADINLVIASDNCGTPVKAFLYDSPPFDAVCLNRLKIDRFYQATDAAGNTSSCSQRITVHDAVPPNLLFVPANVTVECNAIPQVAPLPSGVDNCAGDVTVVYDGQTVSNIICTDSYTLTRQWTATDACGNTKTATQRITVRDTQRPLFTSVPPNVTVECNAVPSAGNATATDNCDSSVSIAYEGETRTNGVCTDSYTLTRRWRATDNCGNTRTATQRITVRDTQKPVFTTVPQNVTIQCTDPAPNVGSAAATDNCDASVTVTYLGQNSTYSNCPNNYQITRIWRATDNCGNSTTAAQVITVQDTQAPVFTSVPANVTIQCTDPVPFVGNATATDACAGYVQITFLGQSNTGGDCPQEYVLTRTWRAQDECGNSVTASQTITVQDNAAPAFVNPPANVTVYCPDIPSAPVVTAQDNCGTATVNYLGQNQSPGDCGSGYTITRTWTADDGCGNTATHTQLITVLPGFSPDPEDRAGATGGHPDEPPKDFRIMPNPSSGELYLDLSAFAGAAVRLAVYNNVGVLVWEQKLPKAPEMAMRLHLREQKDLPAGVYRIMVEYNGERYVKTLVLLR